MAAASALDKQFSDAKLWRKEATRVREILLGCGLTEDMKWGKPCYAFDGHNVCIIQRMKGFLALLFFKGALLEDTDGVLEAQGPNSRAGYRMRFTGIQDVERLAGNIRSFVRETIDVEKAGLKVAKPSTPDYPAELTGKLARDPEFKAAFDKLTPGRQRGYVLHFSQAKQAKTRIARIEKYRDRILDGKGMHDR